MSIDRRVVDMQFNNAQFERGIEESVSSLDKLKQSLKFDKAVESITGIERAVNSWDLSGASSGVSAIEGRFSTLGIMGMEVIRNLTNSAMNMGKKLTGFFTTPILEGGKKRAVNIEQAKFQFGGLGMDIEQAMEDALYAVKGTAYGLDEAAIAASTLGASGVELGDDMKGALRGISGVAAMTNSGYGDMARIFGTVAGQGKLMTMQMRQIEARGVNVAAVMAESMGTTEASVRDMVTAGSIDFDTFATIMNDSFGEHATKANETYTGSLSNVRAALSRVGAMFYGSGIVHMKNIFNSMIPLIDNIATALDPVAKGFDKAFGTVQKRLSGLLEYMSRPDHGATLMFAGWSRQAKPIIEGIGSLIKLVSRFAGATVEAFGKMTKVFKPFTSAFVDILEGLGLFATKLEESEKERNGFSKFFEVVGAVLSPFGKMISAVGEAFRKMVNVVMFGSEETEKRLGPLGTTTKGVSEVVEALGDALGTVKLSFDGVGKIAGRVRGIFEGIIPVIKNLASQIGEAFSELFNTGSVEAGLKVLNTGLIGGLVFIFQKALTTLQRGFARTDLLGQVQMISLGVNRALKSLTAAINAKTLIKIAGAVAILVGSIVVLSMIDSQKLATAVTVIGVSMAQLLIALNVMGDITSEAKAGRIAILSVAMIGLSIALNTMANAVRKLAQLKWEELVKGLAGVAGMLVILTKAMKHMEGIKLGKAVGLIALAGALNMLANVVTKFGNMDTDTAIKGIGAMGVVMLELALFSKLAGGSKNMTSIGVGMIAIAGAMRIFTKSISELGSMNMGTLAKGIGAMGATLLILSGALRILPKGMVGIGVGLMVVAQAVGSLSTSVGKLGEMDIKNIAKGVGTLAAVLGVLAGALHLMKGTLAASAALMIAAGALVILAPALKMLGSLPLSVLGVALLAVAGAFTAMGIAGYLLAPVAPAILMLAAAYALFTTASIAMSAAMLTNAAGMTAMAAASVVKAKAMTEVVKIYLGLIPSFLKAIAEGIIQFIETIADGGVRIKDAVMKILSALMDAFIEFLGLMTDKVPEVVEKGVAFVVALSNALMEHMPLLVQTAFELIISMINGLADAIRNNHKALWNAGINLITAILDAMWSMLKDVWNMGKDLGTNVIEGADSMIKNIKQIGVDMIKGMVSGVKSMASNLYNAARNTVKSAVDGVKNFLGIRSPSILFMDIGENTGEGLAIGISNTGADVDKSARGLGARAVDAMKLAMDKASDILDSDMELNPTITPVLDMDDVDKGIERMNDGLELTRAISLATSRKNALNIGTSRTDISGENTPGVSSTDNSQNYNGPLIKVESMTVRNDSDIEKVAEQLYSLTLKRGRA